MDRAAQVLEVAHHIYARANETEAAGDPEKAARPPIYKVIGICLAIASGLFIGCSFVLKKVGLLKANEKYEEEAGEGYGYLKNFHWWAGMTLMIIGEICNFVAYAFTDAILVTPLGALSVVITTVLSAIFLKERLSMVGKVSCFLCIVGSVVIVMNAPAESSVANIQEMQHYVIAPGFLSYAGVIIVGSVITAFYAGPRWGKKNMLVYISICSWVGGLSVVATQGLGAAIVAQVQGTSGSQFKHWFLYVLFVFVIGTLLTEIIFLNVSVLLKSSREGCVVANLSTESFELIQCRHGDANLLRLFYQHYHHYVSCAIPRIQGHCVVYRNSRHGISHHLLRRCAVAAVQVSQGCARYRRLCRRPRSDSHYCRAGTARDRTEGRCHPWRSRYCS